MTGRYGSVENLRMVAEGEADVGFATVDTAEIAVSGNRLFGQALPLRALCPELPGQWRGSRWHSRPATPPTDRGSPVGRPG